MGVWTACFFFGQFSSPLLVSLLRGTLGTMQAAFLTAGLIGLAGAVLVGLFMSGRNEAAGAAK
jgi:hypothetical protein